MSNEKKGNKVRWDNRRADDGGNVYKRKNIRLSLKLAEWIETTAAELGVTQSAFMALKLNESMAQDGFLSGFEKLQKIAKEEELKRAKEIILNAEK